MGVGIHAGETVETPEGYVGSAVSVAARVCGQARAGEVLVTDTVRALTRTFLPVRFVDRRTRRLKGVAEAMVLYRVEPLEADAAIGRRAHPAGHPSSAAVRRIGGIAISMAVVVLVGATSLYLVGVVLPAGPPAPSGLSARTSRRPFPALRRFPIAMRRTSSRSSPWGSVRRAGGPTSPRNASGPWRPSGATGAGGRCGHRLV